MKKLFVLLASLSLLLGSFSAPVLAQKKLTPGQMKQIQNIEKRIKKLPPGQRIATINALDAKLKRIRKGMGLARMRNKQAESEAEIWRIEKELELLKELQTPPPPPPPPSPPPKRPPAPRPKPEAPPRPKVLRPRSPQFGLSAGYMAGMLGAMGEVRFHDPFDLLRTTCRLGIAYAQGEDTAGALRKHALVVLDGIYRLNPPQARGIRSYFGMGINYDAYTTGQKSGGLGGQVFYGVEGGQMDGGQMFFEIGYGTIRTGFSPDHSGLTALIGYKF